MIIHCRNLCNFLCLRALVYLLVYHSFVLVVVPVSQLLPGVHSQGCCAKLVCFSPDVSGIISALSIHAVSQLPTVSAFPSTQSCPDLLNWYPQFCNVCVGSCDFSITHHLIFNTRVFQASLNLPITLSKCFPALIPLGRNLPDSR